MYIEEIVFNNFRNIRTNKITLSKNFNVLYGKNAQGKTSVIEAIYFLSTGKSFRTRKVLEQIKEGEKTLTLFSKTSVDNFSIQLNKEKKDFYISKNKVKYKEYIGKLLAISFSPEDISLIMDTPENRRRFFNYEMSQISKLYLNDLINFQKVLKVRNKLIKGKKMGSEIFKIYNDKYIFLSQRIYEFRKKYISDLSKYINQKYKELFDKKELIIRYEPSCDYNKLKEILEEKKEKELFIGFSIYGPQKDEYSFLIDNKKVKTFASQGEKKSVIFSLKLAQIEYIINSTKKTPIVLLDDITAYFDEIRKKIVLEYFKEKDIQCIFTSTEDIDICAKKMYVSDGEIKDEI